jgi:hypothetical protein
MAISRNDQAHVSHHGLSPEGERLRFPRVLQSSHGSNAPRVLSERLSRAKFVSAEQPLPPWRSRVRQA